MCTEAVEIDLPKDKKLRFDKNSVILFPVWSIHLDSEYYPNPKMFDPDRFSPENGGVQSFIDRGVFLRFGIGPRMCPGNNFAAAQSKLAIAALVKNFAISVNPKTPQEFVIDPRAIIVSISDCFLDFKEIIKK